MSCKREQLIRTGATLFEKHGMRWVTVEEICRQAGVSKPTFYRYFDGKAALARRVIEQWISEGMQQIDEIERARIPFPEKMERILAVRQDIAARLGSQDLDYVDIDLGCVSGRVMRFLVRGQQRGDVRSDIRPEYILAAFEAVNRV